MARALLGTGKDTLYEGEYVPSYTLQKDNDLFGARMWVSKFEQGRSTVLSRANNPEFRKFQDEVRRRRVFGITCKERSVINLMVERSF